MNEIKELNKAYEKFKFSIIKSLKIDKIIIWLNKIFS